MNMIKPDISPNFTVEDIHKIREYNYEMTKHMTFDERMKRHNKSAEKLLREIEELKKLKNKD
jgi:hypothetical protein